jgi:hypothetical protein
VFWASIYVDDGVDWAGFLLGVVNLEYACCYLRYFYGVQDGRVEVVFVVYADIWSVFVRVPFQGVAVGVGVSGDVVVGECYDVWCVLEAFKVCDEEEVFVGEGVDVCMV